MVFNGDLLGIYWVKKYEFVNWDDDIPDILWKNKRCSKQPDHHFEATQNGDFSDENLTDLDNNLGRFHRQEW